MAICLGDEYESKYVPELLLGLGPLGFWPAYNQKWLYAGPSCV